MYRVRVFLDLKMFGSGFKVCLLQLGFRNGGFGFRFAGVRFLNGLDE